MMKTVKEVAEVLSLSIAKVYSLIAQGELACYRFGRSVRVSDDQLSAFLDATREQRTKLKPTHGRHF